MNKLKYFQIATALCLLAAAGCAKKVSQEIEFGSVVDSTYKNAYFGVSLPLPPEWSIQGQEESKKLTERGANLMAEDSKQAKALVRATEQRTVNLLAAFKFPLGSPVPSNPSIMSIAEKVDDMPGIQRGKDYHFHTRKFMESGQLKTEFSDEIYTEKLGGVPFDVMRVRITVGPRVVSQKHYATVTKGYALLFVTSFISPEEETEVNGILDKIKFN